MGTAKTKDNIVALENYPQEEQPPQKTIGVQARMLAVMADVHRIAKADSTPQYAYASHDDVVDHVRPLLAKHGLRPVFLMEGEPELMESQGNDPFWVKTKFSLYFMVPETGESTYLQEWWQINPLNGGKGIASARSYAKKEMLKDAFFLTTGDTDLDDDAESKSAPRSKPKEQYRSTRDSGPDKRPATDAQLRKLFAIMGDQNVPEDELKRYCKEVHNIGTSKEITRDIFQAILIWLDQEKA